MNFEMGSRCWLAAWSASSSNVWISWLEVLVPFHVSPFTGLSTDPVTPFRVNNRKKARQKCHFLSSDGASELSTITSSVFFCYTDKPCSVAEGNIQRNQYQKARIVKTTGDWPCYLEHQERFPKRPWEGIPGISPFVDACLWRSWVPTTLPHAHLHSAELPLSWSVGMSGGGQWLIFQPLIMITARVRDKGCFAPIMTLCIRLWLLRWTDQLTSLPLTSFQRRGTIFEALKSSRF